MSGPRVVVTGARGQLGRALQAQSAGQRTFIGLNPPDDDICRWPAISQRILEAQPTLVIHAAAATDALADLDPDSPDVPFFRGLIAWQGHRDAAAAIAAFDTFLEMAPDDPRVPMIRGLRGEASAETD